MTEACERKRWRVFGAVRDAEGRTRCIHSSSGIYSCPEERGEWGRGLSCGFHTARQRGRKWEARGRSDVSERGEAFFLAARGERKGERVVFECLCVSRILERRED